MSQPHDIPLAGASQDTDAVLQTLLSQGKVLYQQLGPLCEESATLLKQEGRLAVQSVVVGSRWLVATVIAAITSWLGLNVAAVAALHAAGLPLYLAILLISVADALLAVLAHRLATQCLADMRFSRSRELLGSRHAPR
ncbi:hypothetical protein [Chitinimonas naiadis]